MYYLEDLPEGMTFNLGSVEITKDAIIEFAEKYDPQKFHLDEEVATSMFGGLIASGFQTMSLYQRLLVDGFLGMAACMASPGMDEVQFIRPVFAGDLLTGKLTILSTRRSESKPNRGMVKLRMEMFNAANEPVLGMIGMVMVGARPQG